MDYSIPKIIFNFKISLCILIFAFCIGVGDAGAASASLYFSPSGGNYTVGNTFSVDVKINTGGEKANAADATLVFDTDDLEAVGISKNNSVFSLWVQEPIFSNSQGAINFAGGKPSPGFSGTAGTIITVTFRAKTAGQANLGFAAGSVLADDGKGTNILSGLGSAIFNLAAKTFSPSPPADSGRLPSKPVVSSLTHSEAEKHYSNNDPEFSWELPDDVTGVSFLLNDKPLSNPGPISDGLLELKKFEDVADGVNYFHIKFRNEQGWGPITHRKFLIDTALIEPLYAPATSAVEITAPIEQTAATSLPSVLKFGTNAIGYLMVIGTLIVLTAVLIGVIFYIWYRVSFWRKKIRKETKDISRSVNGAFRALKDEVEEQIASLDKKPGLTREEKNVRDRLQDALSVSEKLINKELKDVEKEVE